MSLDLLRPVILADYEFLKQLLEDQELKPGATEEKVRRRLRATELAFPSVFEKKAERQPESATGG